MNILETIKSTVAQVINEEYSKLNKNYILYEGDRIITVMFPLDNSRLQFEIHFRNNHGVDKENHRKKAASKWRSLASKIHNESKTLNEVGNPVELSWKESFLLALKSEEMKPFIRDKPHQQIYRK